MRKGHPRRWVHFDLQWAASRDPDLPLRRPDRPILNPLAIEGPVESAVKRVLEHACANGWTLCPLWTRKRTTDPVAAYR